jgi:hypothetical protein
MSAGACVTHDRELTPGWRQVVAQRAGDRLRMFVDDRLVAESAPFAPALSPSTRGVTLKIGDGPRGPFRGRLREVWIEQTTHAR